jgi:DUF1707 SHOCT-like domain
MAGPDDEKAAAGRGRLRASHADREQVIEVLQASFVQGRLDRDEFGLRVGRALASRTYADLATLTADLPDLPGRPAGARPPEPPREPAKKMKAATALLACATPPITGLLVTLPVPRGSILATPVLVLMCVLFGAVSTGWLVLFHAWLGERAGRQSARPALSPRS